MEGKGHAFPKVSLLTDEVGFLCYACMHHITLAVRWLKWEWCAMSACSNDV